MSRVGRRGQRRVRGALLLFVALVLLAAADGFWIEPRLVLRHQVVELNLVTAPARLVHLSDLHIGTPTPVLRKLLREVAQAEPDLIVISGDLVAEGDLLTIDHPNLRAAAATIAQLRRTAPVIGVQGHSEFLGTVVGSLEQAGLEWLSNEGRYFGPSEGDSPGGGFLLLGLNQQVGRDLFPEASVNTFGPLIVDQEPAWGRSSSSLYNAYFHYDPSTNGLADTGGPLSWSGYELTCEARIEKPEAEIGVGVHSRYPLGEDRMIRLRRPGGSFTQGAPFSILPHGTAGTSGQLSTGVVPEVGRWYRIRLRTEVEPGVVIVRARVWPSDRPEPEGWQAWFEDRGPQRVEAGTVGLWSRDGGGAFRNLEVRSVSGSGTGGGKLLLAESFAGTHRPPGWRDGTRGSRLAMALARSPSPIPKPRAGARRQPPRIVLSHTPAMAPEAARRGIEAVLSGHTHGGQVRLPGRALITRSPLGPHYDRGLFRFASPNAQGWTQLYINPGVGTSLLPVRFLCLPSYAVIEVGHL